MSILRTERTPLRRIVALVSSALLMVPASPARVIAVRADWAQARNMLAEDGVRPPIRVLLQSGKQLKGKFATVDEAGLTLKRGGSTAALAREDIREIRITYRTDRKKKRILGGVGGYALVAGITGAVGERGQGSTAFVWGMVAMVFALPVYLWKLGARADRGATVIELVENATPAEPPASRQSPAIP